MKSKARVIAFYLPQYHPIPENDEVWGKGFTEWTNVGKAKPLFRGHMQPHVPADLGYYDLRMPEVREQQAQLAKEAGIEGFCYWHYWFGNGKQLLENIFNEVVDSGHPDFPFCLGWANHSWSTKSWVAGKTMQKDKMIMEQTYPGQEDNENHFYSLLKAFKDNRYIKVDNKLLFVIYMPLAAQNVKQFMDTWNELAKKEGLLGFHFVGIQDNANIFSFEDNKKYGNEGMVVNANILYKRVFDLGFDAVNSRGMTLSRIRYDSFVVSIIKEYWSKFLLKVLKWQPVRKYDYKKISQLLFAEEDAQENVYPTLIPNWDRTPRSGNKAVVWYNYNPKYFYLQVKKALKLIENKQDEHKILFLMSWNEWGEGNYMEPDLEYGHGYINALRDALNED
ncbi:MAG: glycoside hydrolase family 99-like domain-containing protein [Paludibacteraceae bacterium]|nr:glycoside hydrolase family 99-like domain-containing protein [Paludibacteraceae bacterium]